MAKRLADYHGINFVVKCRESKRGITIAKSKKQLRLEKVSDKVSIREEAGSCFHRVLINSTKSQQDRWAEIGKNANYDIVELPIKKKDIKTDAPILDDASRNLDYVVYQDNLDILEQTGYKDSREKYHIAAIIDDLEKAAIEALNTNKIITIPTIGQLMFNRIKYSFKLDRHRYEVLKREYSYDTKKVNEAMLHEYRKNLITNYVRKFAIIKLCKIKTRLSEEDCIRVKGNSYYQCLCLSYDTLQYVKPIDLIDWSKYGYK